MYEKHGETIKAQTFLDALQSDAVSVIFTNCTLEVIFGYMMLGGLISIFSNKLASRS